MDVDIILVPYDSGQRGARMGAGPEALVAAGLPERLEGAGHNVEVATVELPPGTFRAEIRAAFDLAVIVAERVRAAREAGRWPLVLAGNCNSALGVVAGLGPDVVVVWCDAHGDFNTPETTTGGFLDGMGLATLTGRCWGTLAARVPGFVPAPESRVWLVGARDIDPLERIALDGSGIRRVSADRVGPGLALEIKGGVTANASLYLHLDLDVLDPAEGRANGFAVDGGVSAEILRSFCVALDTPAAAMLSSYDPAFDGDGRIAEAGVRAVLSMLAPRASVKD